MKPLLWLKVKLLTGRSSFAHKTLPKLETASVWAIIRSALVLRLVKGRLSGYWAKTLIPREFSPQKVGLFSWASSCANGLGMVYTRQWLQWAWKAGESSFCLHFHLHTNILRSSLKWVAARELRWRTEICRHLPACARKCCARKISATCSFTTPPTWWSMLSLRSFQCWEMLWCLLRTSTIPRSEDLYTLSWWAWLRLISYADLLLSHCMSGRSRLWLGAVLLILGCATWLAWRSFSRCF